MNARAYLTILRPVRTLLLAAFYAWALGFNLLKSIGGASMRETNFLTLVAIAPIFLGFFLLGPLHEVMHRSFSVLLPGARDAFLRWHLRAVTVAALLLLGAAEFCHFEFPRAASLGLILAGLSLPLLNKRTAPPSTGWYMLILALTACAFATSPARAHLIEAGRVMPWLILTGGAACALLCFRHGFAADRIRERSRNPLLVFCFQSLAPIPGSAFPEMQRYVRAENTRRINARKTTKPGNEWATQTVGSSSRDWATVIHHTQFGGSGRIRVPLGFLLMGSLPIFALAAAPFLLGGLMGQPTSFSAYCDGLTAAGRLDGLSGAPVDFFFIAVPTVGVFLTLLTGALATFSSARPPLSRPRLADAVCVETAHLCSLTYLGYGAAFFTVIGTAALIAGIPAGINSFARPLAGMMIVPPLVLGGLALLFLLGRSRWTSSGNTLFALGLILPGLAGFYLAKLGSEKFLRCTDLASQLLSPLGLLTWLALSTLVVWLFRYAVHRHYRKCDLTQPAPWMKFVSAGAS